MNIPQKRFRVYVKPNKDCNSFDGFDKDRSAYVFNIKAPARDNRANKELLRFLKEHGINAVIKSGFNSRTKVIEKI